MAALFLRSVILFGVILTASAPAVWCKPPDLPVDPNVACPEGVEGESTTLVFGYDILLGQPYMRIERGQRVETLFDVASPFLGDVIRGLANRLLESQSSTVIDEPRWQFRTEASQRRGQTESTPTPAVIDLRYLQVIGNSQPLELIPVQAVSYPREPEVERGRDH